MGPGLDDVGKGILQAWDLEYRIQDYGRQIRELDAKAEWNVFEFTTKIAACVSASTNDEETVEEATTDAEGVDGEAFRGYLREYLENEAKYIAELSILEAEKDKIDAEMRDLNLTSKET
jgi:hypothetical protein